MIAISNIKCQVEKTYNHQIMFRQVIIFIGGNPNLRTFSSNFGWLMADKVTRMLVALFVSAWVARYLGPERYGVLAYAVAFISMFQAIALLGLDNLIVRDSSAQPTEAHRYLGTALRLRFFSALVSYLLMIAVSLMSNRDDKLTNTVIMLAGLTIFFQISDVIDLWFQSQVQSRRTVLAKASSYILISFVKIMMITGGAGVVAFAGANAMEASISAIALFYAYRRFRTQEKWSWDTTTAINMLHQSWPLLLSGLSILLYMRVSVIFLKNAVGVAGVGLYTVGTTLSEMWYFVPMALSSSLAPYFSRKRIEGGESYKQFIYKIFGVMWYFSILVSVVNSVISPYLISLVYGDKYQQSARILELHAFTFIPVCIGVMQSLWLVNENRTKLALYQALSGAAVALPLNFFFVKYDGAYGAALATLISQFVQAFLVNALLAPDLFKMQYQSLRLIKHLKINRHL